MSARAMLLAALLLAGGSRLVAAPLPQIPANELPGHERDRFIERFPQPPRAEPVIVVPRSVKPRRDCRDQRRSKRWRRKC